ncbi:hypothetical protein [Catenovulum agarivorans]|uniref:hypothetical protein n=1 Tax=Catenovulum agarivorans TaxID=1172192 RepID=UPI00030CC923|nr:hypothetical protein [Catenovulum agarivorans]
MKNFIIGYGETLTNKVEIPSGSGPKKHPYTFGEAREKCIKELTQSIANVASKPAIECANNEVVLKFLQHPSYLAKSYYPRNFFKKYNVKDLGTRSVRIKPKKWGKKTHPEVGLASCVYVSGTVEQFQEMIRSIESDVLNDTIKTQIQSFETISVFDGIEKIKNINKDESTLKLEVVLHSSLDDTVIVVVE